MEEKHSKIKLLILGSGFAAYQVAKHLYSESYETTIVSPRNHFLFTPLLISSTVGTVEPRNIIEPMRVERLESKFYQAECVGIDPKNKSAECKSTLNDATFTLSYDKLVIAMGADSNTFGVEGVKEHAFFLKETTDAKRIRQRIIGNLEAASLPNTSEEEKKRLLHWVIVGGGPTGSEFAGELHDFVKDARKKYPDATDHVSITLLEAMEHILPVFDQSLQDYAEARFKREGIEVRKGETAKQVFTDKILLESGEEISCGLVVWTTGITPRPLVKKSGLSTSEKGFLQTNNSFQVEGHPDIYALGDTAERKDNPLPATAQVAQQEGKYLAKNLNHIAQGKASKPFEFHNRGKLAYLGGNRALADLPKGSLSGRTAWLFWRSIYLFKLVGIRNRICVLGNWISIKLFGRDTSYFS